MTDILSSNAAGNNAGTAATATTSYEPRQSARVRNANIHAAGDGDIWHEHLVVCEAAGNKLVIRSYFKNSRTKKKVWDEPPTGASSIEPASANKRAEAEGELKTLQAAMDGVSADTSPYDDSGDIGSKKSKKGRGFFGAFRKKTKGNKSGSGATANAKVGGMFGKSTSKKGSSVNSGSKSSNDFGTDGDEDIQRAISLSMGLQHDTVASSQQTAFNKFSKKDQWQEDQEALEMAKAISMSEAEASGLGGAATTSQIANASTNTSATEEEMILKAIEESRHEHTNNSNATSYGVTSMPSSQEGNLLAFSTTDADPGQMHHAHQQQGSSFHPQGDQDFCNHFNDSSNVGFLDQKMPAKVANLKNPPPTAASSLPNNATKPSSFAAVPAATNTMNFDPYAQGSSATAAAMPPTAGDSSSQGNHVDNGPQLRKMDEQDDRNSAASLGRLMHNKKTMEDEAGIV